MDTGNCLDRCEIDHITDRVPIGLKCGGQHRVSDAYQKAIKDSFLFAVVDVVNNESELGLC